jgi:hypothetical protein
VDNSVRIIAVANVNGTFRVALASPATSWSQRQKISRAVLVIIQSALASLVTGVGNESMEQRFSEDA